MTPFSNAFCGALLLIGLVAIIPTPASAGTHYDRACDCWRPNSEHNTRRVVLNPVRIHTTKRYVDHTRVVKRTRLIRENRLVVHVQPVINREIIVHRQNTVVRNITLHKVNTINRTKVENRYEVVNRYAPGTTRYIDETRNLRAGTNRD